MLKIDQLISGYGSVQILNGANMKVEKQSIVALLGGNGTGKSTILRAASGLIRSWKGTIEFDGEQIQNLYRDILAVSGLLDKYSDGSVVESPEDKTCLLYTSDAADE